MLFILTLFFSFSATPLADYYIIAGVVYQAPDLGSVLNSRMVGDFSSCFFECEFDVPTKYTWSIRRLHHPCTPVHFEFSSNCGFSSRDENQYAFFSLISCYYILHPIISVTVTVVKCFAWLDISVPVISIYISLKAGIH